MAVPKRKTLVYLQEDVGLKADVAEEVAKYMEDEYEVEDIEDLKHLSSEDMDNILEKTGLKRVRIFISSICIALSFKHNPPILP